MQNFLFFFTKLDVCSKCSDMCVVDFEIEPELDTDKTIKQNTQKKDDVDATFVSSILLFFFFSPR